jgi:hypothetical protein
MSSRFSNIDRLIGVQREHRLKTGILDNITRHHHLQGIVFDNEHQRFLDHQILIFFLLRSQRGHRHTKMRVQSIRFPFIFNRTTGALHGGCDQPAAEAGRCRRVSHRSASLFPNQSDVLVIDSPVNGDHTGFVAKRAVFCGIGRQLMKDQRDELVDRSPTGTTGPVTEALAKP